MLGHSNVQLTMRVYAHIFEADREKVAANVDRAVNEVHEMCTEPDLGHVQVSNFQVESPSDLRFFYKLESKLILEHRIMSPGL